jgi:hypothetical protein
MVGHGTLDRRVTWHPADDPLGKCLSIVDNILSMERQKKQNKQKE